MDYKEYKESLSTTNGKGDDEYVVDTTEPKDIQSKLNTDLEVLVNLLTRYIIGYDIKNIDDLITVLTNKTYECTGITNIRLENIIRLLNTSTEVLLDPEDGIDKTTIDGIDRTFDKSTNTYKVNIENNNITKVLNAMNILLQYKNQKYGNSALQPINVFSKESSEGSILIRLDDKLSRIKNSDTLRKNDISDIMGYLTLLCVSKGWDDFSEFKD
jgi:DNA polymerase II large subunit